MREPEIKALLKRFCGKNVEFTHVGDWIMVPCPLAPWAHESGKDSNPSFGVHVNATGYSGFNCFTCGAKGPKLSYFVTLYESHSGDNLGKLITQLERDEAFGADIPEYEEDVPPPKPDPIPHYLERMYDDCPHNHPYIRDRGILRAAVEAARLMIDHDDHGAERIVFPVYGLDGKCYGFTGRATDEDTKPKVRDYHGLNKKLLVLGLQTIAEDDDFVVLVEGLFDHLVVQGVGFKALAVMHSTLTDEQAAIIKEVGKPVVLFYDNDAAGRKGTKHAIEKLEGFVPLRKVDYKSLQEEHDIDVTGLDPGIMEDEEIAFLINNAEVA